MKNFARGPLATSISGGADSGIKFPFSDLRNPFVELGASSTDLHEIPHALPYPNPFDQAGVLSTDLGEILPALLLSNPFDQARASFTDLHALSFPDPFNQDGAASSSSSLSVKSWEIALDGGMYQLEESCPFIPLCKILLATNKFEDALVIGTGGFGKVYKGTIDDGATTTIAAVKRLNVMSNQGLEEFWTEVNLLSKLRHTHLVSLIGYCNEHQEMILVYEYIARGTLANHLYKTSREESGGSSYHLTWERRLKICLDAALGLDYLHNGTKQGIIHRDVKSTNILLDENLVAKVSDFGISKRIPSCTSTHVTTNVKGTFGYYDPDYFLTKRLTKKSDVYAFGVVLLEVLCGRPPIDTKLEEEQISLILWAQKYLKKGKIDRIIDPSLNGETTPQSLKQFAKLANDCLRAQPKERPTMSEVVEILKIALASHERKGRSQGTITKGFQGMRIVPKGLNRWWQEANTNDGGGPSKHPFPKNFKPVHRRFSLSEIRAATENFNKNLLISQDRCSKLYKGCMAKGTPVVVIKRFELISGEVRSKIQLRSLAHHPNIMSLIGLCDEDHELILVYDYMVNGTLESHIDETNEKPFSWRKRLQICIDVAGGLEYLHTNAEQQLVHCYAKPSNVFLDDKWVAKVAAYELSLPIPATIATEGEGVEYAMAGTLGYLDPESQKTFEVSKKSEMYAFGVMLLEVLCAKTPYSFKQNEHKACLIDWLRVWILTSDEVIDPSLFGVFENIAPDCFRNYVILALSCVVDEEIRRPSIDEVLHGLQSSLQMQKDWDRQDGY